MTPTCSIKQLPPDLLPAAAQIAVDVNPANGLNPALRAPTAEHLAVYTGKKWSALNRTFSVQFLDTTDQALISRIIAHMNAWYQGGACLQFAYTAGQGEVRIARENDGYWSYLGTDINLIPLAEPTMNLEGFTLGTALSEYRRVVTHETGHTLGFPHEHLLPEIIARIDVVKAMSYFRQTQGWDQQTVRDNVLTPLSADQIARTPTADEQSIMCYALPGAIMLNGIPVWGGETITELDQAFANLQYPQATVPVEPPVPVDPRPEPPTVQPAGCLAALFQRRARRG